MSEYMWVQTSFLFSILYYKSLKKQHEQQRHSRDDYSAFHEPNTQRYKYMGE